MKPYFTLHFPAAGRTYCVRTNVLWQALVGFFLQQNPDGGPDKANAAAKEIYEDELKLAVWAKENMTWRDLMPHSLMVKAHVRGMDKEWADAEISFKDAPVPPADVSGDEFMETPVAAIVTSMTHTGRHINVLAVVGPDGKPNAAVMIVQGPHKLVEGYINVVNDFAGFLAKHDAAAQAVLGEIAGDPPTTH